MYYLSPVNAIYQEDKEILEKKKLKIKMWEVSKNKMNKTCDDIYFLLPWIHFIVHLLWSISWFISWFIFVRKTIYFSATLIFSGLKPELVRFRRCASNFIFGRLCNGWHDMILSRSLLLCPVCMGVVEGEWEGGEEWRGTGGTGGTGRVELLVFVFVFLMTHFCSGQLCCFQRRSYLGEGKKKQFKRGKGKAVSPMERSICLCFILLVLNNRNVPNAFDVQQGIFKWSSH